jgi:hypothetical protein
MTKKKQKCGSCTGCLAPRWCGACRKCLDMPKYGGPGVLKEACAQRKCVGQVGQLTVALHYTTLQNFIALHCITTHCSTAFKFTVVLYSISLQHCITLHYNAFHCSTAIHFTTALHNTELYCITLHCSTADYCTTTLQCTSLQHCITLYCITA